MASNFQISEAANHFEKEAIEIYCTSVTFPVYVICISIKEAYE